MSDDGTGDGYGQIGVRAAHHVRVGGHGSLPDTIEALLVRAGVGTVSRHPGDGATPDIVVLASARSLALDAGREWHSAGVPHLPVVSLGHRVTIGPLVRPGAGPCLRCLHLHRSDRDPAWPIVLAQLVGTRPGRPPDAVQAETALTTVAAGLVAMVVHASIAGRHLPLGASMEIALPWPRIEHREWEAHPRCTCVQSREPHPPVR